MADKLKIPFYALNLNREFGRIIDYFVDEYASGRTPNPCVQCNNWIKFGKLFDYADGVGAPFVATGHYARIGAAAGGDAALLRGVDSNKDQSYVLFGVRRDLLSRMLLPVGEYQKRAIREIAGEIGLNVAEKRDSQEICFVTRGRYDQFVRSRRASDRDASGDIVTVEGAVVGRHTGIEGFTVGQRKGLGVAVGEPAYVVRIEADTRRVVLGRRDQLGRDQLTAGACNWFVGPDRIAGRRLAQIRYNSEPAWATVECIDGDRIDVRFDRPQFGVAPGQAVVCYDGDRVLGGGWID